MGSPPSVGVPVRPTDLGVVASLPQHRGPSVFPTPIAGARRQPSLACLLSPMLQGEAGGGPCRGVALWTTQRPRGHCHREGKKTCHMWPVPYQADKWWEQWVGGGCFPPLSHVTKRLGGLPLVLRRTSPQGKPQRIPLHAPSWVGESRRPPGGECDQQLCWKRGALSRCLLYLCLSPSFLPRSLPLSPRTSCQVPKAAASCVSVPVCTGHLAISWRVPPFGLPTACP